MPHRIYISYCIGRWCAVFDNVLVRSLADADKNKVVRSAVSLAKRLYGKAVIVILGADGRLLEERIIGEDKS